MSSQSMIPKMPGTDKVKTFLSKKEKIWGNRALILTLFAAGVGLYVALPFIISFLNMAILAVGKLVFLGLMAGGLAWIWYIVSDPRFLANLWYIRAKLSRRITKWMIHTGPLDIIYAFVNEYLNEKLSIIKNAYDNVEGTKNDLVKSKADYEQQIKDLIEKAAALKRNYYDEDIQAWSDEDQQYLFRKLSSRTEILSGNLKKTTARLKRAERYCQIMKKMYRAWEYYIDNTRYFAEALEEDYKQAQQMAAATAATEDALGGDVRAQIYGDAVKYVENKISVMTGKVDRFIEVAPQLLAEPELIDLVAEDAMMNTLAEWDKATDDMFTQADGMNQAGMLLSSGKKEEFMEMVSSSEVEIPVKKKNRGNKKYQW